jgi:molybdenum cofactor guanylyltransferase
VETKAHKLAGLVLCGGQSSRMGTDKGLIQKSGRAWAEIAYNKLNDLGIPVCISIHPAQQQTYQPIFPESTFIIDSLPLRGPLAGLLSAHQKFPQHHWLVLACDLPDMTIPVLQELLRNYHQNPDYECFVFANENEPEPLCGIYRATGLRRIMNLFGQNLLKRHSMKHVLEISKSRVLALPDEWKPAFKNYNSPFGRQ